MKQSRSYQNCLSKHSLPLSFTLFLLSLICQTPSWFSISAGLIITFHSHPSSLRGSNYTHTHPHTHTHTPIVFVTHTTWWSLSWGRTSIMKAPRVCVCVCVCVCVWWTLLKNKCDQSQQVCLRWRSQEVTDAAADRGKVQAVHDGSFTTQDSWRH